LRGGQACVLYGAAEFSRDTDFAILASSENLARLLAALEDLEAEVIAVPPFEAKYLRKGHAIHFRCRHPECAGMRIDVMTKMRGVAPFSALWARRTSMRLKSGFACELMSLFDLVHAKKTRRDKDWPMIRRLTEVHYFANREHPTPQQVIFWLQELRTPELLIELVATRKLPARLTLDRPLLKLAQQGKEMDLFLRKSGWKREADRQYWTPLKAELENFGTAVKKWSTRTTEAQNEA